MRKYNQPKGLRDLQVLVNDTSPTSRYFEVDSFPTELTAGKNLFKIQGNQSLLAPGSDVQVEVVDRNNDPIYHEVVNYIETDTQQRVVAIYVYPDTPPGFATVYIVGRATSRPNGSRIPPPFDNQFNVRWEKRVLVRPRKENNTEIILTQTPRVTIQEKIKTFVTPVEGVIDLHFEFSGSNMRFERLGQSVAQRDGLVSTTFQDRVVTDAPFFSQSMEGGQILFPSAQPNLQPGQTLKRQLPNGALQNASGITYNPVIQSVLNETTALVSPRPSALVQTSVGQEAVRGMGNTNPPLSSLGSIPVDSFPNTAFTCSFTDFDVPMTTQSTNTVSFAKVALSNIEPETGQIRRIRTSVRSAGFITFMPMDEQDLTSKELFTADDTLGIQQNLGSYTTQSIIDRYWRADTVIKESLGSPPCIYHSSLQLDVPQISSLFVNAPPPHTGSAASTTQYQMVLDNSTLLNALKLRHPVFNPANTGLLTLTPEHELHTRIVMNVSQDLDDDGEVNVLGLGGGVFVNAGNTYQLTFKLALAADDRNQLGGQTNPNFTDIMNSLNQPKLEIALSGSAVDLPSNYDEGTGKVEVVLDEITTSTLSTQPVVQAPIIQPASALHQRVARQPRRQSVSAQEIGFSTIPVAPVVATQSQANLEFRPTPSLAIDPEIYAYEFTPSADGYIQVVFKHYGGVAFIQGVSIKSLDLRGFTPNHTYVQFEVPTFQQDDILDFKFDLLDNNNNIVTSFTTRSMAFTGSNQFIDNGQVTGNMMVGEGIMIEGIETR